MDGIWKGKTLILRVSIQPKLLLLYSAGMALVIDFMWDLVLDFCFRFLLLGALLAADTILVGWATVGCREILILKQMLRKTIENTQRPKEIKGVNGFEERLKA
jgi:hypothetical protein